MPGREGTLHHCPISGDSCVPGTSTSALCRSQELVNLDFLDQDWVQHTS